jgi:2-keto-4-pentenoate hydratase/2-oxohepta-3-ene-1,7-dioic acid hydratase in catechol pathway
MKIVNFRVGADIRLGIKTGPGIIDVAQTASVHGLEAPATLEQVIGGGPKALAQLAALLKKEVQVIAEDQIIYAPCVTNPEKIVCVGLNYVNHAAESKMDLPVAPVLFSKYNNALAAHRQDITLPQSAVKFDYEAELVMVIGKEAAHVTKEDALSYVFGYTAGNDLSARDLQFRTGQWLLGKTCDHFAPLGPYLVTADEVDPGNLEITCKVNGELRQSANTRDLIFDCPTIISYISQYMTLKPGDVIFTGTPGGVILGYPEAEQQWLRSGDKIEVSIEKIGVLANRLS